MRRGSVVLSAGSLLPLLLWLLAVVVSSAVTASAQTPCMYDAMMRQTGPFPVAVLRDVPRRGGGASATFTALAAADETWEPIRITTSLADLEDTSRFCTAEAVSKFESRPDFMGGVRKCNSYDIFTEEKRGVLLNELIPATIKLHSERLKVQRVGENLVVPKLDGTRCAHFTIPATHQTDGVPNADKVLYVAVTPGSTWATTCATLGDDKGRPIASAMSFAAVLIAMSQERVRTYAHELAHALGFNYETMQKHGLITNVTGIRGKAGAVSVIAGDKTKEAAQKHFDCDTAPGMELEDEGQSWFPGAHWERRNAKDELMNAYVGIGLYTALTMSFFEDLKYYKAQWGMEEPMSWGSKAGCDFLEKKCIENGRNPFPDMFCTESECNKVSCTSDRMSVAHCQLEQPKKPLADYYQYFADTNQAGSRLALTDYCPIFADQASLCTNEKSEALMSKMGSRVGGNSRCLKGDALRVDGKSVGDVCAEVRCNDDRTVDVRYLGDDEFHACPEGETISPTATFSSGKLLCPKYTEVCTVADNGASLVKLSSDSVASNNVKPRTISSNPQVPPTVEGRTASDATIVSNDGLINPGDGDSGSRLRDKSHFEETASEGSSKDQTGRTESRIGLAVL